MWISVKTLTLGSFAIILSLLIYVADSHKVNAPPIIIDDVKSGLPIKIVIQKINLNTSIEYVGKTADGAMDVPKNQKNVAWYKLGKLPGEKGTAVIAGHYGWSSGKSSAFDNLNKLEVGDGVQIITSAGKIISFSVTAIKLYDPNADADEVFNSNEDQERLNLITCEGVWDKTSKSYSKRLVVFTEKN